MTHVVNAAINVSCRYTVHNRLRPSSKSDTTSSIEVLRSFFRIDASSKGSALTTPSWTSSTSGTMRIFGLCWKFTTLSVKREPYPCKRVICSVVAGAAGEKAVAADASKKPDVPSTAHITCK